MLIGLGKEVKKQPQAQTYTISFITNADSGTSPTVSSTIAGGTFTIPSQGNLVKTEINQVWTGSGFVPQQDTIYLHGWSDGNLLYFPGDTYTMPSYNVTFTAIWRTLQNVDVTSMSPTSAAIGSTVTFYGSNLGSTTQVKFYRNKIATFTVKSDTEITAVVPSGTVNGSILINLYGGGSGVISGFTRI